MTTAGAPGRSVGRRAARARSARVTACGSARLTARVRSPRPHLAPAPRARTSRPFPVSVPRAHSPRPHLASQPPAQSASCPYQARSSCFIDRWKAITSASTTSGCIWADSDFFACIRSGPLPDS